MSEFIPQSIAVDAVQVFIKDRGFYVRQFVGTIPRGKGVKWPHRLRPEFGGVDQRHDLPDDLRKCRAGVIVDDFAHGGFRPVVPVVEDEFFNPARPVGRNIITGHRSAPHIFRLVIGGVQHAPGRIKDLRIHVKRQPAGGIICTGRPVEDEVGIDMHRANGEFPGRPPGNISGGIRPHDI